MKTPVDELSNGELPETIDSETTIADPVCLGPFTMSSQHAQGGLGKIFRATDPELNRIVAVKTLQERFAENAEIRRRFTVEAEITARLEHPGIVPVYRMFTDERGCPAYAMRFIEGQTFWDSILAYHAGKPDPVSFNRLLQCYLHTCHTIGYAHSRGVIHRDLKPQNIMLGKFGESLVVDWGLAKVVGRVEDLSFANVLDDGATLVPSGASPGCPTQLGSAVGTPAFMSPEQAAGRWDVIDHRTDVYGLGAVLYTILTGRKPLEGDNWPELQQKIQQGDFPAPRQIRPSVPAALEAVCLKAMAVRPEDRYSDALEIAEEIEHWLADEPVAAHRESASIRLRRWVKRNRTFVNAACVLVATTIAGLIAGLILLELKNREIERQRETVEVARKKAEFLNRFLTDDLLRQADPAINPVGEKLTVRQLLDKAAISIDDSGDFQKYPDIEANLRTVLGQAYQNLGSSEQAEHHFHRAWNLRSGLLGPDHIETLMSRNDYVYVVADRVTDHNTEKLTFEAYEACQRALGASHPETARALGTRGLYRMNSEHPLAEIDLRESSRILHQTLGDDHRLSLDVDNTLAVSLAMSGRPKESIPLLMSVVDRRKRNPRDPDLALAISNLGYTQLISGNFSEARRYARESIQVGSDLVGDVAPGTLQGRTLLGYSAEAMQNWNEAEKEFLTVLEHRQKTLPPDSLDIQRTNGFLARLYAKQERWTEASRFIAALLLSQKADTARSIETLASEIESAMSESSDPKVAEPLLRECVEGVQNALWQGDWLSGELASRHGDCIRRAARPADAELILINSAKEIAHSIAPPEWSVRKSRKRVADVYLDLKKPEEAARWQSQNGDSP